MKPVVSHHDAGHGTIRSYTIGFALSVILTLAAYVSVVNEIFKGWDLVAVLGVLAVTQLFVQLFFFLHLGRESKPRWNLQVLVFAAIVVVIVVFGSIWIMKNLEYNHGHVSEQEIIKDEGYKP